MHRYQIIANTIEQEIRQSYSVGDYLPAEGVLAERFEVNRHTLRHGLDLLVQAGWLMRQQGKGVKVISKPIKYPLHQGARFTFNLAEQGYAASSEVLLRIRCAAPSYVAKHLGLNVGDDILFIRTLRRVNDQPCSVIDHYFVDKQEWQNLRGFSSGSLQTYLEQKHKLKMKRIQTHIRAINATPELQKILQVGATTPFFTINTLHCEQTSGKAVEYSMAHTRADQIELYLEH